MSGGLGSRTTTPEEYAKFVACQPFFANEHPLVFALAEAYLENAARCVRAEEALRRCFRYVPDTSKIQAGEAGKAIMELRREVEAILRGNTP